jgi:hypothetical protein
MKSLCGGIYVEQTENVIVCLGAIKITAMYLLYLLQT